MLDHLILRMQVTLDVLRSLLIDIKRQQENRRLFSSRHWGMSYCGVCVGLRRHYVPKLLENVLVEACIERGMFLKSGGHKRVMLYAAHHSSRWTAFSSKSPPDVI